MFKMPMHKRTHTREREREAKLCMSVCTYILYMHIRRVHQQQVNTHFGPVTAIGRSGSGSGGGGRAAVWLSGGSQGRGRPFTRSPAVLSLSLLSPSHALPPL